MTGRKLSLPVTTAYKEPPAAAFTPAARRRSDAGSPSSAALQHSVLSSKLSICGGGAAAQQDEVGPLTPVPLAAYSAARKLRALGIGDAIDGAQAPVPQTPPSPADAFIAKLKRTSSNDTENPSTPPAKPAASAVLARRGLAPMRVSKEVQLSSPAALQLLTDEAAMQTVRKGAPIKLPERLQEALLRSIQKEQQQGEVKEHGGDSSSLGEGHDDNGGDASPAAFSDPRPNSAFSPMTTGSRRSLRGSALFSPAARGRDINAASPPASGKPRQLRFATPEPSIRRSDLVSAEHGSDSAGDSFTAADSGLSITPLRPRSADTDDITGTGASAAAVAPIACPTAAAADTDTSPPSNSRLDGILHAYTSRLRALITPVQALTADDNRESEGRLAACASPGLAITPPASARASPLTIAAPIVSVGDSGSSISSSSSSSSGGDVSRGRQLALVASSPPRHERIISLSPSRALAEVERAEAAAAAFVEFEEPAWLPESASRINDDNAIDDEEEIEFLRRSPSLLPVPTAAADVSRTSVANAGGGSIASSSSSLDRVRAYVQAFRQAQQQGPAVPSSLLLPNSALSAQGGADAEPASRAPIASPTMASPSSASALSARGASKRPSSPAVSRPARSPSKNGSRKQKDSMDTAAFAYLPSPSALGPRSSVRLSKPSVAGASAAGAGMTSVAAGAEASSSASEVPSTGAGSVDASAPPSPRPAVPAEATPVHVTGAVPVGEGAQVLRSPVPLPSFPPGFQAWLRANGVAL